jgi:hypothetical protein
VRDGVDPDERGRRAVELEQVGGNLAAVAAALAAPGVDPDPQRRANLIGTVEYSSYHVLSSGTGGASGSSSRPAA